MDKDTLYLTGPPDTTDTRREWIGSPLDIVGLMIGAVLIAIGVFGPIGAATGFFEDDVNPVVAGALVGLLGLGSGAVAIGYVVSDNVISVPIATSQHGNDDQVRGLYSRIEEVTEHSTAGWDDDLWQSLFAIGQLCEQKHQVQSAELGQELHDAIAALRGELDEMITARQNLVERRRELGMSTTVPGNADQRAVTDAAEELEALAFRPLLRDRIEQAKNQNKELP